MLLENKLPLSLGRLPMAVGRVKQQLKSIVLAYPPDAEEPIVDERKLGKLLGRHSCGGRTRFEHAREAQLRRLA